MKITIEEMLVERDIISRQQLERVKEIQKSHEDKSLTDMLLLLGYTTEDVIMNCFSDRDDMEIIHLEERTADPAAIEMLPESFIVNNEIVPVCFEKGDLLVACAFPVDPDILEEAATISGMTIRPVLTPADQIQKMLSGMETITEEKKKAAETGKTAEKVESAPAVRLVNTLIESAYKRNASDIHIEPGKEFLTIRFRIDGDLCMYTKMEMSYHRPVVTRLKLMGEMDIAEKRLPQDGKYRYEKEEMATDLRISTLPSVYGEKVVLRLLGNDRDSSLIDVRRLGMDEKQEEIFGRMLKAPFGIILVTGPTNSFVFGPVVIHPDLNASATCLTSSSVISGGENGIFIIYTSFLLSLKQCNFHSFFRIFFSFPMLFFKCRLIYLFRFFKGRNNLSQHFFRF